MAFFIDAARYLGTAAKWAVPCALLVAAHPTWAANNPASDALFSARAIVPGEPLNAEGHQPPVATILEPPAPSGAARVTVSRAADLVGRPVYFSHSRDTGPTVVVAFSSRSLPTGAVFSVALKPSSPAPSAALLPAYGSMPSLMPVSATAMTSGFGFRRHPLLGTWRAHNGIDLAAMSGSPIVATSDGVVNTANWNGGYGLYVALDHGGGIQTRYGHMSRLNVQQGQPVRKGDVIGYVGSTGMSTGPHLHYEVRINGQAVKPTARAHAR